MVKKLPFSDRRQGRGTDDAGAGTAWAGGDDGVHNVRSPRCSSAGGRHLDI